MSESNPRPPVATAPLSVVLPARNAGAHVGPVLAEWSAVLAGLARDHEILVVDDHSADDTRAQVEALARTHPGLRILTVPHGRGFGAALRVGIAACRHPLLCWAPCDRQYKPADLNRLLGPLAEADLVIGHRQMGPPPRWLRLAHGGYRLVLRLLFGVAPPAARSWLGWQGLGRRLLARWVFGVRVHDPECAFGLFRHELLARIPVQLDGAFAKVEVLAKANFLGALMAEEPVAFQRPLIGEETVDGVRGERLLSEAGRLFRDPDFGPAGRPPTSWRSASELVGVNRPAGPDGRTAPDD